LRTEEVNGHKIIVVK